MVAQNLDKFRGEPSRSGKLRLVAIESPQRTLNALTQAQCFFEHRVEHRDEIAGRSIDDLYYLGHRGLAGERLVALGGPRVELAPKGGYGLPKIDRGIVRHCLLVGLPTSHATIPFRLPPCQQECKIVVARSRALNFAAPVAKICTCHRRGRRFKRAQRATASATPPRYA